MRLEGIQETRKRNTFSTTRKVFVRSPIAVLDGIQEILVDSVFLECYVSFIQQMKQRLIHVTKRIDSERLVLHFSFMADHLIGPNL